MKFFDILGRFINFRERPKNPFSLRILDAATEFNRYHHDRQKLAAIFSSPAMLKVTALQCDLFSVGQPFVQDANENELPNDPFLNFINNPNPFQSQSQFLWDYMLWVMLGTAYCYVDSKVIDKKGNKMYFLDPSRIEWPREIIDNKDKLIFSDKTIADRAKLNITYRYEDNTTFTFPLDRLIVVTDLTNGVGNWYKGASRIDALYKIISNSEAALDAKNINVKYSGKFMVAGQADPTNLNQLPLGQSEKEDIETKMNSDKTVHAVKSMIEIKRFVEDMKALQLNQAFMDDYYSICLVYNIPRDVAEAFAQGSTYENQEKARASHVSYTLQPKGNALMDAFEVYFGYNTQKKNIGMSWEHLPLMQVFEKDKSEVKKVNIENFKSLLSLGVPIDEVNAYLGTDFTVDEKKVTQNGNQNPQGQQGSPEGSPGGQEEGTTGTNDNPETS